VAVSDILLDMSPTFHGRVCEFSPSPPHAMLPILGGPYLVRAGCPVRFRAVGNPAVAWWCPDGHDPGDEDEG
jgi:hypothetical protein